MSTLGGETAGYYSGHADSEISRFDGSENSISSVMPLRYSSNNIPQKLTYFMQLLSARKRAASKSF